jgi:hypothetical protein
MTKQIIQKWRNATEELAQVFTEKYFPAEEYGKYTFWAGDEIGGVFCVSDYFFDVDRMIEALELGATFEQIGDYVNMELEHCEENSDKPMPVNFKNYVKYGNEKHQ